VKILPQRGRWGVGSARTAGDLVVTSRRVTAAPPRSGLLLPASPAWSAHVHGHVHGRGTSPRRVPPAVPAVPGGGVPRVCARPPALAGACPADRTVRCPAGPPGVYGPGFSRARRPLVNLQDRAQAVHGRTRRRLVAAALRPAAGEPGRAGRCGPPRTPPPGVGRTARDRLDAVVRGRGSRSAAGLADLRGGCRLEGTWPRRPAFPDRARPRLARAARHPRASWLRASG